MKERELETSLSKYYTFLITEAENLRTYVGLYNMDNELIDSIDKLVSDIHTETEAILKLIGRRQRD